MPNVIAFPSRQRPLEPEALAPLDSLALHAHLEEAARTALDAADKIIAALDRIEGAEAVTEPSFNAMPAHAGRVSHLRESATPALATEPETPQETPAEVRNMFPPLPWSGAGNVVAAAGCAVLTLVGMRA